MNLNKFLDVSGILPDLNLAGMPNLEVEVLNLEVELPYLGIDLAF
jgi:hypothetical protein